MSNNVKYHMVVGYVANASHYCLECAPSEWCMDDMPDLEGCKDSEGNEIGVVFAGECEDDERCDQCYRGLNDVALYG